MSDGTLSLWLWTGGFLAISDWLTSTPHAHMALQLAIGIHEPVRVQVAGRWREAWGVLVDTDVEHGFDGSAGLHAVLHVDAETTEAHDLRSRVLRGTSMRVLDGVTAAEAAAELAPLAERGADCEEVRKRFHAAVGAITEVSGREPAEPVVDERLLPVLQRLKRLDEPTPAVAELAAMAHLSESRFQHLFRAEMGMPVTRYALWQRMLAAAELLADGVSATRAAHDAGFADSAHLAREFRRFNGQSPTGLGPLVEVVTVCEE